MMEGWVGWLERGANSGLRSPPTQFELQERLLKCKLSVKGKQWLRPRAGQATAITVRLHSKSISLNFPVRGQREAKSRKQMKTN